MWAILAAWGSTESAGMSGSAVCVEIMCLSSAQVMVMGVLHGCMLVTLAWMLR
jgi:hypothetical protein